MLRYLILLAGLFVLIACGGSGALSDVQKAAITTEVKTMMNNYVGAIKAEGLTAEFKYLDQSPDFFWIPPGYQSALGYDSVRAILERTAPSYGSIDYHFDQLHIFPLTAELANYHGILSGILVDTSGMVTNISLIESGLLIKRDDGWKYLSGQTAVLPVVSHP